MPIGSSTGQQWADQFDMVKDLSSNPAMDQNIITPQDTDPKIMAPWLQPNADAQAGNTDARTIPVVSPTPANITPLPQFKPTSELPTGSETPSDETQAQQTQRHNKEVIDTLHNWVDSLNGDTLMHFREWMTGVKQPTKDEVQSEGGIPPLRTDVARALDYAMAAMPANKGVPNPFARLLENEPERIVTAAIQAKGKTYTGNMHFEAMSKAVEEHMNESGMDIDSTDKAFDYVNNLPDYSEGFTTTKGRYVDRVEAYKIAEANKQRMGNAGTNKSPGGTGWLLSEDLKDNPIYDAPEQLKPKPLQEELKGASSSKMTTSQWQRFLEDFRKAGQ